MLLEWVMSFPGDFMQDKAPGDRGNSKAKPGMDPAPLNRGHESGRKVTAILQGRVGSTRLPGKVLLPLAGKPVMQHVYERILHCSRVDRIIIATSDAPQDDPIVELFENQGVPVFRGSESDPLDRYYHASIEHGAEHVVRVMADCPLTDPKVIDEVVNSYFEGDCDLCYLGGEYPTGLDTTVFSFQALKRCHLEAQQRSEREHVTSYMTNNPEQFRIKVVEMHEGLYHHRWVMDHEADYRFMQAVYETLYKPGDLFVSRDILSLLDSRPDLAEINAGLPRDEGIRKAMADEQSH